MTPQISIDLSLDDEIDMIFTIKNDEKQIVYHNFIIIALKNGTSKVFSFDESFQLNEENNEEFKFLNEAPLFCKRIRLVFGNNFKSCNFVLQATNHQLRLLDLSGKYFFFLLKPMSFKRQKIY